MTSSEQKIAVLTGANSGVGLNALTKLYQKGGFKIILAVRSKEKAESAIKAVHEEIAKGKAPENASMEFVEALDLGSLASTKKFADAVVAKYPKIDLLINNAGLFAGVGSTPQFTSDGFELTFGCNHVGPTYLTTLLLPAVRAAKGRIVFTSSELHEKGHFEGEDWQLMANNHKKYSGLQAYNNSKLANVLTARELHKREAAAGTGVTVSALHPGFIPSSELLRTAGFVHGVARYVVRPIMRLFGGGGKSVHTLDDGGNATMAAAFHPTGNVYFFVTQVRESSSESKDETKAAALWAYTESEIAKALAKGASAAAGAPASAGAGSAAAAATTA
jgi:NAD(P)-dependent dehydrogenase (short-subunit alcohol dehydrogenase family)